MSLKDRIRKIRGNRTQEEFGKIFGFKPGTYAKFEKTGKMLSPEFLEDLSKKEKVNINWLITGKGDPYTLPEHIRNNTADKLPQPDTIAEETTPYRISPITPISPIIPSSRKSSIPLVGRVAAGEPVIIYADCDQSDPVDVSDIIDESFYYRLKYNYSNPVCFVEVSGDSMEPEFHDHDLLLIERNVPHSQITRNIYGIFGDDRGEWTFKRFNPQGDTILLEPLNSRFNTIAIPRVALRIFGVCIALFRSLR
jgi:SOS-response transcriptional repressor LexA